MTESESQCRILFTFIERNINLLYYQLDKKNDCVTVPLDHYAGMSDLMKHTGADRKELSRQDLKESACFCDKAVKQVRQLKNSLLVNFIELDGILGAYERAYPEDKHMVAEFRASHRQLVNKLIS